MPVQSTYKAVSVLGALAVLVLAGCGSDDKREPIGDPLSRAAKGELSANGGAARLGGNQTDTIRGTISGSGARNIILLIGDGMGDSEITLARNYEKGAGGFFDGIDALPLTGSYTTYALTKDGKPDYVADSASSASGWSTGTKTYDGALGVNIKGEPQKSILELAKDQGFATGDVTTSEIQDATPAALFAHISDRDCYGPDEMAKKCPAETIENGGLGSVTEQLLAGRPDVTMGGGAETFAQTTTGGEYKGKTLEVQAKERGFQVVRTADELANASKADQDAPLLGLFADGNMPVSWAGPPAVRQGYLRPAAKCVDNPEHGSDVPELADMTQKTIDLLKGSQKGKDKGFFLQVESASIDKRDHAADVCGQIGETVVFDQTVKKAIDFAKQDGNTLVIATADHGHTSQIVEPETEDDLRDVADEKKLPIERVRDIMYPGLTVKLTTADDADMTVSYGTSEDVTVEDQTHTGAAGAYRGVRPACGQCRWPD